jgi:plasmid stabilization system protein ParE
MDFKVAFSKNALKEIEAIQQFIGEDDPERAREVCDELFKKAISLNLFPYRHALCPHRDNVRKVPVSPYLIYYRINERKRRVTILHFWHSARQHPML